MGLAETEKTMSLSEVRERGPRLSVCLRLRLLARFFGSGVHPPLPPATYQHRRDAGGILSPRSRPYSSSVVGIPSRLKL